MATTLAFKPLLDLPEWRSLANAPSASAAGVSIAWDQQLTDPCPYLFQLVSNTLINVYNTYNDEWAPLVSPALAGTFGAGAGAIFCPHYGPAGSLGASASTSDVVISTVLGTAIVANQWANQGNKLGFMVRVIGSSAGSSGKVEERRIVGNTAGTTPTLYLDTPLSFTPAAGDTYELLSGRVYCLGAGTTAAGTWKYFDLAFGAMSGNMATTNLPATISTDSDMIALSEAHTPYDRSSNEGFFGRLTATATAAGTLTGQAALGDAVVLANEYRNFVIRIVEDTAIPTAVGQRRNITSHTLGASPVYTLASNWTVTPSATAKYVIENDRDKILLWTSASAVTYTYSISGNAWNTATFANRPAVVAAGVSAVHGYAIEPDARRLMRNSFIYSPRGTTNVIDLFDIAGAAAGAWTGDLAYVNKGLTAFALGTSMAIDPVTNSGCYAYVNVAGTQRFARFCFTTRHLEPFAWFRYTQGAAVAGQKVAFMAFQDGATRLGLLMALRNTGAEMFQVAISR